MSKVRRVPARSVEPRQYLFDHCAGALERRLEGALDGFGKPRARGYVPRFDPYDYQSFGKIAQQGGRREKFSGVPFVRAARSPRAQLGQTGLSEHVNCSRISAQGNRIQDHHRTAAGDETQERQSLGPTVH